MIIGFEDYMRHLQENRLFLSVHEIYIKNIKCFPKCGLKVSTFSLLSFRNLYELELSVVNMANNSTINY